jgi:hypothetical protein
MLRFGSGTAYFVRSYAQQYLSVLQLAQAVITIEFMAMQNLLSGADRYVNTREEAFVIFLMLKTKSNSIRRGVSKGNLLYCGAEEGVADELSTNQHIVSSGSHVDFGVDNIHVMESDEDGESEDDNEGVLDGKNEGAVGTHAQAYDYMGVHADDNYLLDTPKLRDNDMDVCPNLIESQYTYPESDLSTVNWLVFKGFRLQTISIVH